MPLKIDTSKMSEEEGRDVSTSKTGKASAKLNKKKEDDAEKKRGSDGQSNVSKLQRKNPYEEGRRVGVRYRDTRTAV